MQKIAGIMLILGAILFIAAAFSPISRDFFPEPDAARQLEIVLSNRQAWNITQILFTSGAVVTAIGLGVAAYALRDPTGRRLATLGFVSAAVGASLWIWHCYLRAVDPQAFVEGSLPAWHFVLFTLLTQAALVLFGAGLLRSGSPAWVGWLHIGGALFFLIVYLLFNDMPPFAYYVLMLMAGMVIFSSSAR